MFKFCFALLICLFSFLGAADSKEKALPLYDYQKPEAIDAEVWESLQPYLLPSNHPVKKRLDKIFGKNRAVANSKALQKAGFPSYKRRKWSRTTVSKHPSIRGYILKMFTDDQSNLVDYEKFLKRIKGAESIRAYIKRHALEGFFKVPCKWIYPLPEIPASTGAHPKHFVLVAEDMKVCTDATNRKMWRKISLDRLKAYYTIVEALGLKDNVYIHNCPFCKDGKQAFIDTEWHHAWPIHYEQLASSLKEETQLQFWDVVHSKNP